MFYWQRLSSRFRPPGSSRLVIGLGTALSGMLLVAGCGQSVDQDGDLALETTQVQESEAIESEATGTEPDSDPHDGNRAEKQGLKEPSEASLVIWSIDSDRRGIALALAALSGCKPYEVLKVDWTSPSVRDKPPASLYTVIRDLVDQKNNQRMDDFALTLRNRASKEVLHKVQFRFAEPYSLSRAWRPLYESLATEESLKDLRSRYQSDHIHLDRWLQDLGWRVRFRDDLTRSVQIPVVVLAPRSSDDVPALWFLLGILQRERPDVSIPLMVSASATWSVLGSSTKIDYSDGDESPWVTTLSRALGLSTDQGQFRYASDKDKSQMKTVTKHCLPISRNFIQYARSDDKLIGDIHHELVDVRGYRKIAILYRDDLASKPQANSPRLTRRLYGPAISDEFRQVFPNHIFIDSPFPKAPDPWEDPSRYSDDLKAWEKKAKGVLQPILRYFEREQVEAVGVFGSTADEKRPVLQLVRSELPFVQLFTTEPDWELESPTPLTSVPLPQLELPEGSPSYPLNGLMVFSGPVPSRKLILKAFRDLNEVALVTGQGKPFLVNAYAYDTGHIVRRLIDLAFDQEKVYPNLREKNAGPKTRHKLENFLREPSSLEDHDPKQNRASGSGREGGKLMLITNGRLQPISHPHGSNPFYAVGVIGLLVLILSWPVWISITPRLRKDLPAVTLWARLFQDGAPTERLPDGPEGPEPKGSRHQRPSRRFWFVVAYLILVFFASLAIGYDLKNSAQISLSLIPDGHSILPSLLIFLLIAMLSLWLPEDFYRKIASRRPGASQFSLAENDLGDKDRFGQDYRNWRKELILDRLELNRWIVGSALLFALFLTGIEVASGIPLPPGWTKVLMAFHEGFTLWMVSLTGLTFGLIGWAVVQLPPLFEDREGETRGDRLARTDPEAVRHLGTIFISAVPLGLLILALLLMARLHWFGFARWRWRIPTEGLPLLGLLETSLIPLLYTLALVLILGYWFLCYRTFQLLIRQVKDAKLRQSRRKWEDSPAWVRQSSKERRKFKKRRQKIKAIPDEPWNPSASWKARGSLALVLVTWAIPALIGPGSRAVIEAIRPWLGF